MGNAWILFVFLLIISSVINGKEKKEKVGGLSDLFGQMVQNTGEVLANKAKGEPMDEKEEMKTKSEKQFDLEFQNMESGQATERRDEKKKNRFDIFRHLEKEKESQEELRRNTNDKNKREKVENTKNDIVKEEHNDGHMIGKHKQNERVKSENNRASSDERPSN